MYVQYCQEVCIAGSTCGAIAAAWRISNHNSLPRQELVLSVYYVIGLLISSVLLISRASYSFIVSGIFCLFLTFVYSVEIYYSYINLINRSPASSNIEVAPAEGQQPAVISPDSGVVYRSMESPAFRIADAVDLGLSTAC